MLVISSDQAVAEQHTPTSISSSCMLGLLEVGKRRGRGDSSLPEAGLTLCGASRAAPLSALGR